MRRAQIGSAITFGVALVIVLLCIGVAFIVMAMYMGGSFEMKNAADAGALNLAKQVVDGVYVEVDRNSPFYDVTNDGDPTQNDGKINLRRINRVWGDALLTAINADAASKDQYAKDDGGSAGSMDDNAAKALSDAETISNDLAAELNNNPNTKLQQYFLDLAKQNSIRMLGIGTSIEAVQGKGWQTSLMGRGQESNIWVSPALFPPLWNSKEAGAYALPDDSSTGSTRKHAVPGAKMPDGKAAIFLKGYTPLRIGNRNFWQVPYQLDQQPYIISSNPFGKNTAQASPIDGWAQPVPNSFSVEGRSVKSNSLNERAMSWVQTNPQQVFSLSNPHSFVRIKLDEMKAHYYFFAPIPQFPSIEGQDPNNPPDKEDISDAEKAIRTIDDAMKIVNQTATQFGSPSTYGYGIKDVNGTTMPFGGILAMSVTSGSVTVGSDVAFRPLDEIIFGPPPTSFPSEVNKNLPAQMQVQATDVSPGTGLIEAYLLSRINQMISKPGKVFTANDLHEALGGGLNATAEGAATIAQLMSGSDEGQEYYLYSPDGEKLRVLRKDLAQADPQAPWLREMIDKGPDGGQAKIVDDDQCPAPYWFFPQAVVPAPYCFEVFRGGWETWDKDLYWTPGSGYNGCLGQVTVKRWTNVYSLGICVF